MALVIVMAVVVVVTIVTTVVMNVVSVVAVVVVTVVMNVVTVVIIVNPTVASIVVVYHLLDAMEALAMEAEGLFKQNFVLHRPLVWKRCEVWQVGQRLLDVVFVPEQHAKSL